MISALVQTIMECLEEAEMSTPERPWQYTKLQPRGAFVSTLTVLKELESNNLISVHRDISSNDRWWANLEYLGEELLRVLRSGSLRIKLEKRLMADPNAVSVHTVSELANNVLSDEANDGD